LREVAPRVYLLAEQKLDYGDIYAWLQDQGVSPAQINKFMQPSCSSAERVVELCARRCYRSFEPGLNKNVTKIREDEAEYHANILKSGHGAVVEHAVCTFAIENVSRVFTEELSRHETGVQQRLARSQESLRYVRIDDIPFWWPPELEEGDREIFEQVISQVEDGIRRLLTRHGNFEGYNFDKKKLLTSAFRRLIPMGMATGVTVSMNFRALRHILELRSEPHVEVEFRTVTDMLARICKSKWPLIFADFEEVAIVGSDIPQWLPKWSKV
jgi:thymidylate synthase (FAD)